MESIFIWEKNLLLSTGWPLWSCRSIEILLLLVVILSLLQLIQKPEESSNEEVDRKTLQSFRWFQSQYLVVYLIIMLADWLQGTNMYTLYASYGVDIGSLFLTGFLSSAVFGTFLGIYVDKCGRKLGCIIFCILEIVINVLEHIPSMPILIFGRILGGLSTSLLFSAFESWMVSEHHKRGFPEHLLSSTFSISSSANGLIAIVAGVLAQFASDKAGDIGPFQLAIGLTFITILFILPWRENYGSSHDNVKSVLTSILDSLKTITRDPKIIFLGLSQAFFEGGVYSFVFMWVPSLMAALDGPLPTGLVFSSLMLAMTIGGMLFGLILPLFPNGPEGLAIFIYLTAAASMLVPLYNFSFWWVYISFIVLEAMVGMFNSCGGMLRSKYYPEGEHSSIMSVFRLPLNLLVVIGTKLTKNTQEISSLQNVFLVLSLMHIIAFILQLGLLVSISSIKNKKE